MQISALITLIKHRRQEIAEGLVNGNCVNFETYQRLVGQSLGLAEALQMINNLLDEERKDVK